MEAASRDSAAGNAAPSGFQVLRQQRHAIWLEDLTRRLRQLLLQTGEQAEGPLQILLFGSRARGDWDGYSDTDLLVVAPNRAEAERWADLLLEAGLAHDVVALDQPTWSGMETSDSPHWRAVKRQAVPLPLREP